MWLFLAGKQGPHRRRNQNSFHIMLSAEPPPTSTLSRFTGLASRHHWTIWSSADELAARERVIDRTDLYFAARADMLLFNTS
jgi:hypothetical protein